ncbi:hypothetical protein KXD40_002206 [Peronospora effusa]|uniref:Mitochondrial fission 1 protein n=1 Tax=Peronospora effusa TaxID=542832 RepID=A0A3M6VIF6_9STRA|nr:hypothetical protein DD238_002983 [Peronospora effusa]UIZ26194.1 hypothetical protein KXD40_002206 [Peronospora effusa]
METKQKIRDTKRFLLSDLLEQSYALKESLYWIALTLCGLGEYRASRSYCERLLRIEPSHMKAQLLHKRIKEVVTKEDGAVGVGIFGAVVVAGLVLKFLLKR